MTQVRYVQKVGQTPLTELVESWARQGFALAGSPTMVGGTPAQLMVYVGNEAKAPEYAMVEKIAEEKMSVRIARLLDEGWTIYGSMLSADTPIQAMVRGDIEVYKIFGSGSGGVDPANWEVEIARVDESLSEIYAVINNTPDPNTRIDQVEADAADNLAKTVQQLNETISGVDQGLQDRIENVGITAAQDTQQLQIHVDQSMSSFAESFNAEIHFLKERITSLESELQMEAEERRSDIARLESMITGRTVEPAAARAVVEEPAPVEYPPIVPTGSVWR